MAVYKEMEAPLMKNFKGKFKGFLFKLFFYLLVYSLVMKVPGICLELTAAETI